ncbi:hypothetical protein ZWY2020_040995 [Hordeum vulgare]|nr:hypothetical protein ZWY2020_040995 [Hordeum vulgare]
MLKARVSAAAPPPQITCSVDILSVLVPTKEVIAAGAKDRAGSGMIPLGCEPQLLALYDQSRGAASGSNHDPESGCIRALNATSPSTHNPRAEQQHAPGASAKRTHFTGQPSSTPTSMAPSPCLIASPRKYSRWRPCCGRSGAYNFNMTAFCGAARDGVRRPVQYVSWDGVHFTEAANRHTACAPRSRANSPALLDSWTAEGRRRD